MSLSPCRKTPESRGDFFTAVSERHGDGAQLIELATAPSTVARRESALGKSSVRKTADAAPARIDRCGHEETELIQNYVFRV